VALLTALTFVGYFTPIEQLFRDFLFLDVGFWAGFSVLFFAVCTYGNAGWMREIMCTHICPYARFQSAMFDKDTFTVAYNSKRGEQRGPRPRKMAYAELADNGLGECIDCNLCVQVCPTGIDIRNGLQYECINCGACVDACNGVMGKMKYPKGLISFTSEQELNGDTTHILRPKLIGYAAVLIVMAGLLVFEILNRSTLEVDIIRDRNSLYRETNLGLIENVYTLKLLNKSQQERIFSVSVKGLPEYQLFGEKTVSVRGGEVYSLPVSVATDAYNLQSRVTEIYFHVQTTEKDGTLITVDEPSKFLYK
jgi:cytochrome c oxidase accessory protein FixG